MSADAPDTASPLPPHQREAQHFQRFGLGRFLRKNFKPDANPLIAVGGDVEAPCDISTELQNLPRYDQQSDFHCVTSWSIRNCLWSGVRFADFYRDIAIPLCRPAKSADFVVFRARDGYRCAMQLRDLMAEDVLLADRLEGEPLGLDHGAPIRLVAPAHYGYKNVKHLVAIEFWTNDRNYRFPLPYPGFIMDHPRARVALEERGKLLPNWLLRPIYRLFVPSSMGLGQRRK